VNQDAQIYVSLCLSTEKVKQNKSGVLKGHEAKAALFSGPDRMSVRGGDWGKSEDVVQIISLIKS
jgi:hypothetical protein